MRVGILFGCDASAANGKMGCWIVYFDQQDQDQQGQVLHRNILCFWIHFWSQVLHEMPLDPLAAAGLDSVWQCKT